MHTRRFSFVITSAALATAAVSQAAVNQTSLGGTHWGAVMAHPACPKDDIAFQSDGLATIEVMTIDESVHKDHAIWALNGTALNIKNQDIAETFVGTLDGNEIRVTDSWTDNDGGRHNDACTFRKYWTEPGS